MNIPLFDAHCDTLSAMYLRDQPMWKNSLHVDLYRGQRYAPRAQFFAIFGIIGDREGAEHCWPSAERCFDTQYGILQGSLQANRDQMSFCRTGADAKTAELEGRTAAFLSVEGAEILDCDPERLRLAHKQGVRMVTLTWNYENALSGSNLEAPDRGLTERGRRFVRTCEELGVIVDVSHLSRPGFWDVAETATRPFVASHSNSDALCPHSRNLTDDQFTALVRAGGVAGINLYSEFLGPDPDIDTVIGHMEHFLALGGEGAVALGADLDGCDSLPGGVEGVQDMEKLAERLLQKNYTDELVCDIFYNNLMRVVREVCVI